MWLCEVDNNPVPYDDSDTAVLENSFVQNHNGSVKVRSGKNEVTFRNMTQKNIQTGAVRNVIRRSKLSDTVSETWLTWPCLALNFETS